jgi:hypothetical protein
MNAALQCLRWLAVVSLLQAPEVHAQIYRCKDPSGRIAYSESPCPGSKTEQRVVAGTGVRETFLKNLLAIAQHGYLGDVDFIEKTFSIRIEPRPGNRQTMYNLAPPPGSPVTSMGYGFVPGPPGSGGMLDFRMYTVPHCITDLDVINAFGKPQNDSPNGNDRELIFEIRGGPYTTAVWVYFVQKPKTCAHHFLLRVGYPSGSVR